MDKHPPRVVPSWDDYYMALTYFVASRSKDPSTQVGAIIVDRFNKPLGIGYNGAPQAIPDHKINWKRPDKYVFIEHAEINAIDHSTHGVHSLRRCTLYVSAMPCPDCMRRIVSQRIKRVVYGKTPVNMLAESVIKETHNMAELGKVVLEKHSGNLTWLKDRFNWLETNIPDIFL